MRYNNTMAQILEKMKEDVIDISEAVDMPKEQIDIVLTQPM